MKYLSVCMLILSAGLSIYLIDRGNPVFTESYLSAKNQSQKTDKSLLLLFVSDECRVCEDQKDLISNDDELMNFILKRNESAVVNINDFDGKAIRDYYKVKTVPSMLLVNQKGQIEWSHDGNISKSSLINSLENPVNPKSTPARVQSNVLSQTSPEQTRVSQPSTQQNSTTQPTIVEPVTEKRIIDKPLLSYQIQYGFFGNYENANKVLLKLTKSGQSECYIKDEDRNGKTFHRVLSPMYSQIDVATQVLNKMKSKGIDGQMKTIN